jgi:hypothetical protein
MEATLYGVLNTQTAPEDDEDDDGGDDGDGGDEGDDFYEEEFDASTSEEIY